MIEMQYQSERKIEILDKGTCLGFDYYIMNLGTHPTAYIKIPQTHKYFGRRYWGFEDEINVHGGLTYSNDGLKISETETVDGWFIGWDYAHFGDYVGYKIVSPFKRNDKKWKTREIKKHVQEVCFQLVNDDGGINMEKIEEINNEQEANLCICQELKTIMIGASFRRFKPEKLFCQLEYILNVEHGIEDFMEYKIRLLDADADMVTLKEGLWR